MPMQTSLTQSVFNALVRSSFRSGNPHGKDGFLASLVLWLAGLVIILGWLGGGNSWAQTANANGAKDLEIVSKPDVLDVNDMIMVKVFQEEDLETKATIDKDGMVTLPLLGPLKVGKLTTKEASEMVRRLYAEDYVVDPQVSLVVVERAKRHFTVMGQVQKPGTYDLPPAETVNLLTAIAMAGGYTRLAAPSKVTLQRVKDGKMSVLNLNAEKMARDQKSRPFEIMPDDFISVGERVF